MSFIIVKGRRFRIFIVIDDCLSQSLAIEIGTFLSSKRIIRILERVILDRKKPNINRTDNVQSIINWAQNLC
jgi:putative transposase